MDVATLSPSPAELHLDGFEVETHSITIQIATKRMVAACPSCGAFSDRVHSRYTRTLGDLPWHGVPVRICLHTRRFFCRTAACTHRIFTERLPRTVQPYGRKTLRLEAALQLLGLFVGGEPGARLACKLGILSSPDTLLRRAKCPAQADVPTPRCLGVDDWAWRKGQRYGTLLCDLESGQIVDLLPERSAGSLAEWLKAHPGVEVISRDRAGCYVEGAKQGAPEAVQVADRFHLICNLTDALDRILQRHRPALRPLACPIDAEPAKKPVVPPTSKEPPPSSYEHRRQANRARRLALYHEAKRLLSQGSALSAVAQRLNVSRRTLHRWMQHEDFPERRFTPLRAPVIAPFLPYLRERWVAGVTNRMQLFREIREQGFQGKYHRVCSAVETWSSPSVEPPPPTGGVRPLGSVRRMGWILPSEDADRTETEAACIEALKEAWPEAATLERLAREFAVLFRSHDGDALEKWLMAAEKTALRNFARSLRSDVEAVRAAIELPWSNGPTEGHINRLKMVKRQMYGRAGFNLLRARVLAA
jgi:transposase